MLKEHLISKGCFTDKLPEVLNKAVACISTPAAPKMKLAMAASELMTFAGHLRKPIMLPDNTELPINAINVILAGSGESKDASLSAVRKALYSSYELINQYRSEFAVEEAKREALKAGKADAWLEYYSEPRDLTAGIGTPEGLMAHLANLEKGELGAGSTVVSELATELQTSKNITEILKLLAEAYDLGHINSKTVKSNENQTASIKCLPFNAILFGSYDAILFDEALKNKFKIEMVSKFGRRSFFNFNTEKPANVNYSTPEEVTAAKKAATQRSIEAQAALSPQMFNLVSSTNRDPLTLSEEAEAIYHVYFEYNDLVSQDMPGQYQLSKLARKHSHWKTLKLSGMFAVLRGGEYISEEDYVQAINYTEMFADDLVNFEIELEKEPYETFCDYMHSITQGGVSAASTHQLKKLGYIKGTSGLKHKLQDLVDIATSYDKTGIYTVVEDTIQYEKIRKTNVNGASFKEVSGDKQQRAYQCADGFNYAETSFPYLKNLLSQDLAYTPFEFKDGKRGRDQVVSGTSFVVLDVDQGLLTDEEVHFILSDINHHIARTSNPAIETKYRLILQLDAYVDFIDDPDEWPHFIESIANSVGIKADKLPLAQIYFGYEGRTVLSVENKSPIEVKDHLLYAKAKVNERKQAKVEMSPKQRDAALKSPFSTFGRAYEAENGAGNRMMVSCIYQAKELGASNEEIVALMEDINDYWTYPMEKRRFENTILKLARNI